MIAPAPPEPPIEAELAAVSVVIVNYNAGEVLRESLAASLAQARQVVLVDNASDPVPFERIIARFAGHPRLRIIRSDENLGFAAGCNLGLAQCDQSAVLLLNPDSVPAAGAIDSMLATLLADAKAGMVGGLLLCVDGSEQGGGRRAVPTPWRSFVRGFGLGRLAKRWPRLFDDFHLHMRPLPTRPEPVEAISGACMMLSQRALEAIGPLDEGFFLHCEDLDYCMRVRAAGMRIIFDPTAPVLHQKGACSRDREVFVEWHKHRGMMRFYRKHFRHQYPAGLMGIVLLGVGIRFTGIIAVLLAARSRRWLAGHRLARPNVMKPKPAPAGSFAVLGTALPPSA